MSRLKELLIVTLLMIVSGLTSNCERDIEPTQTVAINESEYDVAPVPIDLKKPEYPKDAKETGIEGRVYLKILIGIDGSVKEAEVLQSSGNDFLDHAALKAALQSRFRPALQDGEPVEIWASQGYQFIL